MGFGGQELSLGEDNHLNQDPRSDQENEEARVLVAQHSTCPEV
jgi:hypothetical protein